MLCSTSRASKSSPKLTVFRGKKCFIVLIPGQETNRRRRHLKNQIKMSKMTKLTADLWLTMDQSQPLFRYFWFLEKQQFRQKNCNFSRIRTRIVGVKGKLPDRCTHHHGSFGLKLICHLVRKYCNCSDSCLLNFCTE